MKERQEAAAEMERLSVDRWKWRNQRKWSIAYCEALARREEAYAALMRETGSS